MIQLNLMLKKVYCNNYLIKKKVTQVCSEKESIHIVNLRAKTGAVVQRETCKTGWGVGVKFQSLNL